MLQLLVCRLFRMTVLLVAVMVCWRLTLLMVLTRLMVLVAATLLRVAVVLALMGKT